MKTRILAVALCLVTAAAFGQVNPKVKDLQPFIGTFQCTGTAFASEYGPEHPTTATVTGSWALGGAWVQIHYVEKKTAKNPHPYEVIALWGYDAKMFVAGSFDNMGGYGSSQSPGWQGDKLIFTGPMHGGGMSSNARDTFTKVGTNEIDHEGAMEVKGKWVKLDSEKCKR